MSEIKLNDLARDTGLPFPTQTRIAQFHETPPIDPIWVAKVVVPKPEGTELIAALERRPPDTAIVAGPPSQSTPWWKPTNVVLQKSYYHAESSASVTVVVSDELTQTVLYIEHIVF